MRSLYLGLAAALCVVALALRFFDISNIASAGALVLAGALLVLGLKDAAGKRESAPIELDDDKRATLRELKERGDDGAAIRQVQMWFRDATPERARRVVAEL